jgi:hypothetical protein
MHGQSLPASAELLCERTVRSATTVGTLFQGVHLVQALITG